MVKRSACIVILLLLTIGRAIADDTLALQALLDADKPVQIDRVYNISGPLTLTSRDRITGPGTIRATKTIPGGVIRIADGAVDVTIDGVTIEAPGCHTVVKSNGSCIRLKIRNCDISGDKATNFLMMLDGAAGVVESPEVTGNRLHSALSGLVLKDDVRCAVIRGNETYDWCIHGMLVRGGLVLGPSDVLIDRNRFRDPSVGRGYPRQSIVLYGDPKTLAVNIIRPTVSNNVCIGTGEPYDSTSEMGRGSGDQIVLHCCSDARVDANTSNYGGENGFSITRYCTRVLITRNTAIGNDGNGIHASRLGDQSSFIVITENICQDNGRRADGSNDVMSNIYVQDANGVVVSGNVMVDTNSDATAGVRWHLNIASSKNVALGWNVFHWANQQGRQDIYLASSQLAKTPTVFPKSMQGEIRADQ